MFLTPTKLFIGLGLAAGAAFAMASGGDSREPFTKPIEPPTDGELVAVKQAMCACFRGGARGRDELAVCTLRQVYGPDQDWAALLEPVEGDNAGLAKVVKLFRGLAGQLLQQPSDLDVDRWCSGNDPTPPKEDPELPDVDDDDDDPDLPPPPTDVDVPTVWRDLQSDVAYPGTFRTIRKGDNGIEAMAREALKAVGIASPSYKELVQPLMVAMSRGPRWNRKLYARVAKHQSPNNPSEQPYAYDGRIIKPAWLPRNQSANTRVLNRQPVQRTIADDGDKIGQGSSYGTVWIPKFNVETAVNDGVLVIPDAYFDPPADFLTALGM